MSGIPLHERQYNDYVINVRIDRSETPGGTVVVMLFLGDVPPNPNDWESAGKLGIVTFMGGRGMSGRIIHSFGDDESSSDGSGNRRLETGQISLTNALIDLIESGRTVGGDALKSLDREAVGRYLHEHLHWRVQAMGQNEVPLRDVPSLRVSVAACTATLPESDDEFVQYGPYEVVGSATKGRTCGFNPEVDTL